MFLKFLIMCVFWVLMCWFGIDGGFFLDLDRLKKFLSLVLKDLEIFLVLCLRLFGFLIRVGGVFFGGGDFELLLLLWSDLCIFDLFFWFFDLNSIVDLGLGGLLLLCLVVLDNLFFILEVFIIYVIFVLLLWWLLDLDWRRCWFWRKFIDFGVCSCGMDIFIFGCFGLEWKSWWVCDLGNGSELRDFLFMIGVGVFWFCLIFWVLELNIDLDLWRWWYDDGVEVLLFLGV